MRLSLVQKQLVRYTSDIYIYIYSNFGVIYKTFLHGECIYQHLHGSFCLTLVVLTVLFISNVAGLEVLEFNVADQGLRIF